MKRTLHVCLIAIVAVACLAAVSGGLPSGAADAAAAAGASPPWEGITSFPASYDVRKAVPGYEALSPVRQQENYSTCWVMAATGALEAATITRQGTTPQFSPNNLANHMASRLVFEGMAPSELAAAYYARWEGPVLESQDPYPHPDPGGSPAYLRAARHIQEVLFLPQRSGPLDNDAVKWAVMTYGGVDAAAAFHVWDPNVWNEATASYYGASSEDLNHHILCVGWDDSYPASSFAPGHQPPGDGAFLIKNSWGDWGPYRGYCWLSYYDVNFGRALAVFNGVEGVGNYDAIYQYDALGRSRWLDVGGGASAWYANRFTCAGSGTVKAVSFYTPVPGVDYEIRVAGSVAGVATAPTVGAGTVPVGGYHTVRLEQPIPVTRGHVFVVAVHVTTPGWSTPVPAEVPSDLISPRASAGQSYVSADGSSWSDLTTLPGLSQANVCLKAFADAAGTADTRPPHVDLSGGVVRPGRTATVRWRLEDPAFSSASAIIVLTVRDAGGNVIVRRRLPGVAVGEHGVWHVGAGWPSGRYSLRGHAYDAAGRRQSAATVATIVVPAAAGPRIAAHR